MTSGNSKPETDGEEPRELVPGEESSSNRFEIAEYSDGGGTVPGSDAAGAACWRRFRPQ